MEKDEGKFDIQLTIKYAAEVHTKLQQNGEVVFDEFFQILHQFCKAFKQINTFLGVAFADIKDKIKVLTENNQRFKGHPGLFSFVQMQMGLNIAQYNGGNNKDLKAPKDYREYDSTARNLLRMMWLLTFIKVTFEQMKDRKQDMSDILCKAYDAAFGEKHSWILRNGAKIAIKASSNRKDFVEVITGRKYDEDYFFQVGDQFMAHFIPVHNALWNFYKQNKLTDLP